MRSRSSVKAHALILAIDQGTTGTTCLVVDDELACRGRGYARDRAALPAARLGRARSRGDLGERRRRRPRRRSRTRASRAREPRRDRDHEPARDDGRLGARAPGGRCSRAIVWQDRRTAERCARAAGATLIRERTGLVPDPYFSATKLEWLLARTDAARRERARLRHGRHLARLEAHRRRACTPPT